jgi:octaprenyl-diphosphate synthase
LGGCTSRHAWLIRILASFPDFPIFRFPDFPMPLPANTPLFGEVFIHLKPHMAALDQLLAAQIAEFEPEIRSMADYCVDTSGKRLRPALLFLSGWSGAGEVRPEGVKAAAVVELVHLATLVHDDIMDRAEVRRNRETASRKFGPSAAVLIGDALFAHALHLASEFPTTEVCREVSASTRRVCAGEAVQTLRRGTTAVTREDYYRVIDLKTAELFRLSCHLGSRLAGHGDAAVAASAAFGRHLGIAYQLYDDLADFFGEETRIGKTLGTDLASGKLTLPLFALADRLDAVDRADLFSELRGEHPPRLEQRLRQMREQGVFDVVAAAIEEELALAAGALAALPAHGPSSLLLALCQLLRSQMASLRPVEG